MSIRKVYQEIPGNQALNQIHGLCENDKKVLSLLFDYSKKYKRMYPAQTKIAEIIGACRKTATRRLSKLHKLGIINKIRNTRNKFDTCLYKITTYGYYILSIINTACQIALISIIPIRVCKADLKRGVPHKLVTSKVIFKNPSPSSNPSPNPNMCAREEGATVVMELTTRQAINEIKSLKLTQWGIIRLHAFSDQAIKVADQALMRSDIKKLRDPYGFFVKQCIEEMKRVGTKPNEDLVQHLYREYNAPWERKYIEGIGLDLEKRKEDGVDKGKRSYTQQELAAFEANHKQIGNELLVREKERLKGIRIAAEQLKTKEQLESAMYKVVPGMEALMEQVGASSESIEAVRNLNPQNGMTKALQQLPELQPELPSVEEIKDLDVKFDFVKKIRLKSNLNEFENCVMTNAVRIIDEAKKKYRITDRWNYDEKPSWPKQDEELIAWSLDFLEYTLKQDYSNEWYVNLKKEIEMGPSSPRAQTRELQQGLALMRSLLKKEPVNDAKEPGSNDALLHRHGTGTLEESRMQFQQESAF